ncbi:cytochrome d ubiquinol oxidase subunit II [Georhizobium profundi]|jgi:cytochrome bd ubiquinol oxidase subunit II|uniref:Cytochrome d ubiquinol oxidase subunit II n=1 Tax=Georhizobium profundi TaxID=2341112 RepID=A0A3S9AZP1_9HYPH|nr:cytochrome d ubiquinol oxidase subunit II [Georhizobium profundi]AZN70174.1 cytochrome d ubiquinol oxidase subunit II [Georhizobium profundi]GLQ39793.1 cytochrome bd ubiquinol oxidase subunit II [Rhizobium albus]
MFGYEPDVILPLIFAGLMGISILVYVILDGFDLGIGILSVFGTDDEKDTMIASIGPFWDANETWLVLSIGLLLVAFPIAHGIILTALYLPVFVLLVGLVLRGIAFDFRSKVSAQSKWMWNLLFFIGSVMSSLSQGYMLGIYVLGLDLSWASAGFAALVGLCLAASYGAVGAAWLIYKTEGQLQEKAVIWMRMCLLLTAAGMAMISIATPFASARIFDKWFTTPEIYLLAPLPLLTGAVFAGLWFLTAKLPRPDDSYALVPFLAMATIFTLGFAGLAYSFYPYIVPDQLTIYEAASAPESLMIILVGTAIVLPTIGGYTILAYRIFRGKATELKYD